jgi:hypothetical protein
MVTCAEVHTSHQDVATSKKGALIKINFMSVRENRAKLTTVKGRPACARHLAARRPLP